MPIYQGKDSKGCVSLRKKQYCILNKQYDKESYGKLKARIIDQMNAMPFVERSERNASPAGGCISELVMTSKRFNTPWPASRR